MKKIYIIIVPTLLLLVAMFIGCTEKSLDADESAFIGKWNLIVHDAPSNANYIHELIFYENDTVNNTFWYEGGQVDHLTTEWLKYELNDGTLCFILTDIVDDNPSCYEYEFSNDFNSVLLSIDGEIIFELNKIT